MKTFYSLSIVLSVLFAVCLARLTEEQRQEFEKKLLEECKGPSQATDEDINTLRAHDIPQTRSGKCLIVCTQEKLGIIADGKVSIEGLKALGAKKYEGDDKAIATFNEIAGECQSITDPDNCEMGAKLADCMIKEALKRGVDPKKGIKS